MWRVMCPVRPKRKTKSLGLLQINRLRNAFIVCIVCLLMGAAQQSLARDYVKNYEFNIPQQSVEAALKALATQADVLLLFPYDPVQPANAYPVVGRYTVEEALKVLLKNTGLQGGLTFSQVN